MCGICGMADFHSIDLDTHTVLARMINTLRHRGPDDLGTWTDEHVALAHARLSIIDLDTGRQPMTNEDGSVWIVFNGEIYNFRQLREQLASQGHVFKTRSDTEVIIHLYERDGSGCFAQLRGIFALCIYDVRRRCVYLARDHLGVKPIHY